MLERRLSDLPSRLSTSTLGRSKRSLSIVLVAALGSGACAPLVTQSPSEGLRPANVKSTEGADRLMLDGHDVVAYFTESKHRLGSAQHQSVYKNIAFRFATAESKAKFDQNPTAYVPQYNGYCANGIVYGIPWGGDADSWRVIDGKLYIFGGRVSRESFLLDVPANRKLADQYWKDEVEGTNAFFQRAKRLTMRVPHYKSGEELAKLVAEKGAK
jgi:YHS domain-containing protein